MIDRAVARLVTSIDGLADRVEQIEDVDERVAALAEAAWETFLNPASMSAMEILITTRSFRSVLGVEQLVQLQPGLERIARLIGVSSPYATAIADLLWAAAVGLMVGQMVTNEPLPTEPQRHAMATLIADHLHGHRSPNPGHQ